MNYLTILHYLILFILKYKRIAKFPSKFTTFLLLLQMYFLYRKIKLRPEVREQHRILLIELNM